MKLGFVSAILPEQSLEEVFQIAHKIGYDCVEIMCWPQGKAARRYAGVTHIDVDLMDDHSIGAVQSMQEKYAVEISGLGYYPNPLCPDPAESEKYVSHIKKIIVAANRMHIPVVNSFVGRDYTKTIEDNWSRFTRIWSDIISYAEQNNIVIGIENCPMFFTDDEWPGGKNLAINPKVWRRMFSEINSKSFGLNYDPSHAIWQMMDYVGHIHDFGHKFHHVHAKDARLDTKRLQDVGIMGNPNEFHTPKLPGRGDVQWGRFFAALNDVGYDGPVCVEVEDRAYEGSLEKRIESLAISHNYLRQFIPKPIVTA